MQRMHGLRVLDETHHIKYTFPTPTKPIAFKKELLFSLKKGDQTIVLFDPAKVGKAHFIAFSKGCMVFDNETRNRIPFHIINDVVLPTIVLDTPLTDDTTITVVLND